MSSLALSSRPGTDDSTCMNPFPAPTKQKKKEEQKNEKTNRLELSKNTKTYSKAFDKKRQLKELLQSENV